MVEFFGTATAKVRHASFPGTGNKAVRFALGTMDDKDLQAHSEQALVVVTLSTATLIACVALLISNM
ncbi:hypothetical protein AC630_40165 [Bradyrhizobium sp. AS23.2]|nr:hypothetical protein AC630_40165 [Bradyrhizobium sp. AS23.2]